jgi:hypothetical protein
VHGCFSAEELEVCSRKSLGASPEQQEVNVAGSRSLLHLQAEQFCAFLGSE